jgi:predicted RND superfamily exporter protein
MHRLTALSVRYPWPTVCLVLVLAAAAVLGARRVPLSVGLDAVYSTDHDGLERFEQFLDRFGGGYPILIAYECGEADCGSALDPAAIEMAHAVSRQLEPSAHVTRVTSPASASLLTSSDELGIEAHRFVVDGRAKDDATLRALAASDPLWSRSLVSVDGLVGAIVVDLTSTESDTQVSVMEEIEQSLAPHRARGFRFHVVGEAAFWVAAHEDAVASMIRVGIGTGGMLFLTLLVLLRSFPAVVASLLTVGATSALTMATLPILGWPRSELTNGAATVILVISCADCVHFVARYLGTRSRFEDDASALVATGRWITAPCLMTTTTTAGAFVAMASGGVLSMTRFGAVSAVGVVIAFFLTFSLLPALLSLLPVRWRNRRHSDAWQALLSRLADLGDRHGRAVLAVTLLLAALGVAGIPKLQVEMRLSAMWAGDHPVKRALDFVSAHLQQPSQVDVEITLPPNRSIFDPRVLAVVTRGQEAIDRLEGARETRSLATLLGRANQLLRPEAPRLEDLESEAAIGELMMLVSAGDPGVLDPWLTLDQGALRLSVEMEPLSMAENTRLIGEIDQTLRQTLPAEWDHVVTGSLTLASAYGADLRRSQATIVVAASAIVFALIALYLRSFSLALLAVLPNAVALVLLFGVMGHIGTPVDYGALIVAPIAIGIATDDTIHFLTSYSRKRKTGLDRLPALRAAIASVGAAVITTSAALALGFLSMVTSPFASIANLGLLSALAIVAATLADLLVLPALILRAPRASAWLRSPFKSRARGQHHPPARSDAF